MYRNRQILCAPNLSVCQRSSLIFALFFVGLTAPGSTIAASVDKESHDLSSSPTYADLAMIPPKQAVKNGNILFQQHDNRINLQARHAAWPEILNAIEQNTGVRFHYTALPTNPVNLNLRGRSAYELLNKLFGSATGYASRCNKTALKTPMTWPKEVWVVGAIANTLHNQSPPQIQADKQIDTDLTEEQFQEIFQKHYEQELDNLLDKAKSAQPDERNLALIELSLKQDESKQGEIDALLKDGLNNEDPDVRGQVLYGLANRGGTGAYEILEDGLKDEALGVRVSAVNAVNAGESQGVKLLQQALTDADATVRSLALEKLREVGVNTTGH